MHGVAAGVLLAAGIAVLLLWQQLAASRTATLRPRLPMPPSDSVLRSLQPRDGSNMSLTEGAAFAAQSDGSLFSHRVTQLCSKLAGTAHRKTDESGANTPPVTAAHEAPSPSSAKGDDRFGDQYLALGMVVKARTL